MKRSPNFRVRAMLALALLTCGAQAQEAAASTAESAAVVSGGQGEDAPAEPDTPASATPPTEVAQAAEQPASPRERRGASPDPSVAAEAAVPVAPAKEDPAAPTTSEPESLLPAWLQNFTLGGGAILYWYQPTAGGDGNFSLFYANLILDGKWGIFGLHVEPRFRDTRLRPFFEGPAWVQEVYGSVELEPITLKVGKIYKRTAGLFWDNSFYGNVQVYDGLKLDPNYGASLEGTLGDRLGVEFVAQFFGVDGRTNVSLQGRDTISIADARRRNTVVGRLAPFLKFDAGELRLGVGAERFDADIPDQEEAVTRLGADAKLTYALSEDAALGVWGEYVHQDGRHVVDHPVAGGASGDNHYFLVGGEVSFWKFTARYNASHASYADADTTEWLHVPALAFRAHQHINLLGEFVVWRQTTDGAEIPYDTSLNVTVQGHF